MSEQDAHYKVKNFYKKKLGTSDYINASYSIIQRKMDTILLIEEEDNLLGDSIITIPTITNLLALKCALNIMNIFKDNIKSSIAYNDLKEEVDKVFYTCICLYRNSLLFKTEDVNNLYSQSKKVVMDSTIKYINTGWMNLFFLIANAHPNIS